MPCCGGDCHTLERLQSKARLLLRNASEGKLLAVIKILETPPPERATMATAAPDTLNSAC
jgi:hypothetical protein